MDIRKYFCEWKFRDNFIEQFKTFAVWRDEYYYGNAFIVTNNNEVYTVGSIIEKCVVNDSSSPESNAETDFYEPVKLSLLCGKEIKKFVYGNKHVFICTEEGEVFGFGNFFDEAKAEYRFVFPQKVSALVGLCVVDIAIGPQEQHLALCDDGKLYKFEFGKPSKYLIDSSAVEAKPLNVFYVEESFCVSLLENGKVMKVVIGDQAFSNSNDSESSDEKCEGSDEKHESSGEEDESSDENYESSEEKDNCEVMIFRNSINLDDHPKITKLIGGYTRALAVDEQGRLFVTGHDYSGQLGLGGTESSGIHYDYFKHNSLLTEKVVDIAASCSFHLSAALTESGKVYVWGEGRGPEMRKPQLTAFESLHEVFLYYSLNLETYKPINVDELSAVTSKIKHSMTDAQYFLTNSFEKAFDDPKFCDLFVVVEGKTIPVHKSILAVRCEHFAEVFQKDWQIEKPSVLEIEDGDFKVYKAFLKYLYTDQMDDTLSFNEVIELLNLTNKYKLKSLAKRCVLLIQPNITIENVIFLYESVFVMREKTKMKDDILNQLKESCVKFAANNLFAIGVSDEFAKLNEKISKKLVLDVSKLKHKKYVSRTSK
ncbi:RCC1 and BTB domain-containing protein 1-like [Planococcus citri]|uniref:RCC1 and BTB domain-containing protein 1-like n=1 Tax=Planococcus citri TaxID=170843 RepID=UPI0031F817EF